MASREGASKAMTSGNTKACRVPALALAEAMISRTLKAGGILALVTALAPATIAAPREPSAAEREAVALAAAYLSEGPEAWWRQLADDAPLRRLDHGQALAALEVRAGPPAGAHWRLQTVPEATAATSAVFTVEFPSGMEETLLVRLRETSGDFRIHSVRMSSEPPRGFGAPRGEAAAEPPPEAGLRDQVLPGLLGAAAALLMILAIRRGTWFAAAGLACGAAAVSLLMLGSRGEAPPAALPATVASDEPADLAGLLELRRALAGADPAALEAARETVPADGPAARVARLWQAQHALSRLELNAVDAALQAFPAPSDMPQAERLRARLGFLRLSEVDTALAYERLLELDVWNDALLFEAAQAFEILGFADRARRYDDELEKLGTREAHVYFSRASAATYDRIPERAATYFRQGWRLKPMTRDAVLGHPFLGYLVQQTPALRDLLVLGAPQDPIVDCDTASSHPLALPAESNGLRVGAFLSLEIGDSKLEVPGACSLAPAGTTVLDAGGWRKHRESSMLASLPSLLAAVRSQGDLSRPRMRQEVEETVEALSRRGRWDDVLDLTAGLDAEIASIPPSVVRRRAKALRRMDRRQEARLLLTTLATRNAKNRQVDPSTLYQLANLLVAEGQYDRALKLMARANSQLPFEIDPHRIRQVQMEKRLVNASAVYESEHFEVFYPYERSLYFAERVAEILEAERERLKKWIPVKSGAKTGVFLLDLGDFQSGYGGGVEIAGLFDGKIRVPFADVNTFIPEIVAVLTHELAHAMITEATGDRAPRWLQEGLAQHVEMPQGINPIAGYKSTGSLLSFPMIEAVLSNFAAPRWVPVAYDEARWVLHYIANRHGVRGIHRLLDAFRDGLTSGDALARVTGQSIADFDREVWDWCLNRAPEIWPSEIVHYDTYDAPVLVPEAYEELMDPDTEEEGDVDDYDYDGRSI